METSLHCGEYNDVFVIVSLSKRDDNEHNNGYGFVEFSSPEECKMSIQHCKQETFNEIRLTAEPVLSLMESNEDNVFCVYKNN